MYYVFKLKFLIVLTGFISLPFFGQQALKQPEYDSVLKFRKLSALEQLSLEEQFEHAKNAVHYSRMLAIDSIQIKSNTLLSTLCLYTGKFEDFKQLNFENFRLAQQVGDSTAIANASHNLGWYYHRNRIHNDSAYYYYTKAFRISELVGLVGRQVEILINLSEIQNLEKDYIGSEESAIRAIKLAESLPKSDYNYESLWLLYNRIGDGATTLKLFDKALEYHQKAYAMGRKITDGQLLQLYSKNNIAHVYMEKGDYKSALPIFETIFKQKDLFGMDPNFYALVLDNVTYARFLNGEKDYIALEGMFERAYHLADSLNDPINKLNVAIDMAKYYKELNQGERALDYAKESYDLAKEISFNDLLLESMLLLSELKPDAEAKAYLKEHIALSDSLLVHERGIRNKFARIEFETNQMELENERIATEKMWWTISSIVLLVGSVLVYIIIRQDIKNKDLKFKQVQQENNEAIYNLLLTQQDKVDSAKVKEKQRISQEIHDGILGRLFGTRLLLDSYNTAEGKEAVGMRSKYISELMVIEQDIRKISHELNTDFMGNSGFMDVLLELIDNQAEAYQLEYELDSGNGIDWDLVSNKIKINIYRMVQEALQNIYKHAKAKGVKIGFQYKNSVICLTISDDGIGFVPNKSAKGIGLKNIKSRVKALGGTVTIASIIDQGTTVEVNIPNTV